MKNPDTFTSLPDYLKSAQQEWTTQFQEIPSHQEPSQDQHLSLPDDRYSIIDIIHEDVYSRIYRVRDGLLGRVLAVKQIDSSFHERAKYLRQMKERTSLNHPNILRIYDIDEEQGQVTMEYVPGRNLREILRMRGPLTLDAVMYIAAQLVSGLHYAHMHNVAHHALVPEHVLLTRRCDVKIIAFRTPDASLYKQPPELIDAAHYMPLEWFGQRLLTVASNIYAFGILVYEMLVGKPPFSYQQIAHALQEHNGLLLDETLLPPDLAPILQRCLHIDPAKRDRAIHTVGERMIAWYSQCQPCQADQDSVATYKDFLLMAWADGKITQEEAAFLTHKRQELGIPEDVAQRAEEEVKQELAKLMRDA
jgi:serine/threonine protein kinase